MSSRRVVVGLAAERALRSPRFFGRRHGSRSTRAAPPCLTACGRRQHSQVPSSSSASRQPIHTTPQPNRRCPRTFHLGPPTPPTIHPPSSSTAIATPTAADNNNNNNNNNTRPHLPEQFRSLMRLLTHSVVVCTSTHPSSSPSSASSTASPPTSSSPSRRRRPAIARAMTMSSFTSLALRPSPVISFNVAVPSRTLDAVAASRRFNIHVLADDERGARVADWLAGGNVGERGEEGGVLEWLGVSSYYRDGRPGGASRDGNGDGEGDQDAVGVEPPVLTGEAVLYVLRCKLLEDKPARGLVPVRDHVIVLGEVVEIVEGEGAWAGKGRFGLLYADRRYRQLGNCIVAGEEKGNKVERDGEEADDA